MATDMARNNEFNYFKTEHGIALIGRIEKLVEKNANIFDFSLKINPDLSGF